MRRLLAICIVALPFDASATQIDLIGATYEVSLSNSIRMPGPDPVVTSGVTDDAPVHESLSALNDPFDGSPLEAEGIADTLGLYVHTLASTDLSHTSALAMTTLLFSPMADAAAVIDISWFAQMDVQWIDGFFSLTDVTTQTELGSFGWEMLGGFPFRREGTGFVGGTSFAANLSASDIYQLVMRTSSSGNGDIQFMTVTVAGLEIVSVPEPASILLLIGGLACLARRRHGIPTASKK